MDEKRVVEFRQLIEEARRYVAPYASDGAKASIALLARMDAALSGSASNGRSPQNGSAE
jgi:hypothetical protein